jgi:hypothetical protein
MKRRDEHEKIQAREMAQGSLESGQADDAIDVEKFGKRPRSSNDEIARPFQKVRKREEVDLQWARAAVSAGLPMRFFDNPEVRKAVLMTAECGQNYIRTKPGGVKEISLQKGKSFWRTKKSGQTKLPCTEPYTNPENEKDPTKTGYSCHTKKDHSPPHSLPTGSSDRNRDESCGENG